MPGEGERLVWTYVEALSREDDDTVSTVLSDDEAGARAALRA
jgi:hypothetical protein